MKCLMECSKEYLAESDWKTMALLKICLCAMGVMIGLMIPKEKRKLPFLIAAVVFAVTYVPLMWKFIEIAMRKQERD